MSGADIVAAALADRGGSTAEPVLQISDLRVSYGGIAAVKGVSLEILRGEIVTLIGANGAGKTSLLSAILQLVPATSGAIHVLGRSVLGLETHRIVQHGVALVPEGRAIFGQQTVDENLLLGASLVRDKRLRAERMERVRALFPRLAERKNQLAGTLSGGEQQMLAIGRALMAGPQLLLLDEPSLGLAPKLVSQIFESIKAIAQSGLTLLLVEQNTRLALETADRGYVLATGQIVLCGTSASLKEDPRVRRAYFGEELAD